MRNTGAINPRRLALIPIIDVYPDPSGRNVADAIDESLLEPYSKHRLFLDGRAKSRFELCRVFRLPGLYEANLKKNFKLDMMNKAPI